MMGDGGNSTRTLSVRYRNVLDIGHVCCEVPNSGSALRIVPRCTPIDPGAAPNQLLTETKARRQ